MARPREATDDQLASFAYALSSLLGGESKAVSKLAAAVGVDRNTVYLWRDGKREPQRHQVARLEAALEQPPGSLSRLLGYLPALTEVVGTEAAIMRDPLLTDAGRAALLRAYRAAVDGAAARRS